MYQNMIILHYFLDFLKSEIVRMFLTSFLNIYLNMFLSIYLEAMLFILLKNYCQSKFKMLFYAVFKSTLKLSAIQPCLICSTLPVEFNRRDRSCLDESFKS